MCLTIYEGDKMENEKWKKIKKYFYISKREIFEEEGVKITLQPCRDMENYLRGHNPSTTILERWEGQNEFNTRVIYYVGIAHNKEEIDKIIADAISICEEYEKVEMALKELSLSIPTELIIPRPVITTLFKLLSPSSITFYN